MGEKCVILQCVRSERIEAEQRTVVPGTMISRKRLPASTVFPSDVPPLYRVQRDSQAPQNEAFLIQSRNKPEKTKRVRAAQRPTIGH